MTTFDTPRAAWAQVYRRARMNRYNPKGQDCIMCIAGDDARALGFGSVRFRVAPGIFRLLPRSAQQMVRTA
jgi:hypothetical protein